MSKINAIVRNSPSEYIKCMNYTNFSMNTGYACYPHSENGGSSKIKLKLHNARKSIPI